MKSHGKLSFFAIVTVLLLGLAAAPATVFAQSATPGASSAPAFILAPSSQDGTYIAATIKSGESQEFTIALGNAGMSSTPSRTFVADAYTLTNGGFGVNNDGEALTGATTWIDYPAEFLELKAGEQIERTLTVSVPADAAPGQYISGLVLQTAEPVSVAGTEMLKQVIRKAIAVFITVPGPTTPELTIGDASIKQSGSSNSILIGLSNTGNVLLRPTGTVTLTTDTGDFIVSAPISMGSFYAGTSTNIEIPVPIALVAGEYKVAVELMDVENGVEVSQPALALTVIESENASPVAAVISIPSITLDPIFDQSGENLQFVNVQVVLSNASSPVGSAQLTMHVTRNGVLVEDLLLNSSLVIPTGTTEIQQRYIPLNGWESGSYDFTFTLEAVDANSGQITVLATGSAEGPVAAP
ncbi:hypothetical protein BH09CHL1_BH09CHL1_06550 [soil metagenome]